LGNLTDFRLTGGQASDLEGADVFLEYFEADALLADKAFDADELVLRRLEKQGVEAIIPLKSNRKIQRKYDKELYKARHLIENFFAKLITIPGNRHSLRSQSIPPREHLSGRHFPRLNCYLA
jgi:hypothetical protein